MQSCLYCQAPLGINELIEHCSTGRRLAFDSERGRLWVICPQCGGWNLTPLDDRWEAIDECERLFEKTPIGVSTENISMAVAYGHLEMVRIGPARRTEMAIWRYADQLAHRRRRAYVDLAQDNLSRVIGSGSTGGMLGAGLALVTGGPLAVVGMGFVAGVCSGELWRGLGPSRIESLWGKIIARVKIDRCDYSFVRTGHVPEIRLREKKGHWGIVLPHSVGIEAYDGSGAVNVLGLMLPIANGFGASRKHVHDAVRELEAAGDARAFFETAAEEAMRTGMTDRGVGSYPKPIRLALEMAAHEETERQALKGELKWLEQRWRQAEEIAEIADNLFGPPSEQELLQYSQM